MRAPLLAALIALVVLVACSTAATRLAGTDLGAGVAPDFTLIDGMTGSAVSLAGLRGRVVVLSFLYTACPDTCPLTAERFATAQRLLGSPGSSGSGSSADAVTFVAVSVDPSRDTPDAIRAFSALHGLSAGWHYLIGPRPSLEAVWRAYGILAAPDHGGQAVTHSDAIYLIDGKGRERVLLHASDTADDLAGDLKLLLGER